MEAEMASSFCNFLPENHSDQLISIVSSQDTLLHYPIHIDFADLIEYDDELSSLIYSEPMEYIPELDKGATQAQRIIWKDFEGEGGFKELVRVRISISVRILENPEACQSIGKIRVKHRGRLITLKGAVTRTGSIKMIEGERYYECRKCKYRGRNPVQGTSFQFVENSIVCHDYQEIKIQESTQVLGVSSIPRSIQVVLKDDLVDIVKPEVQYLLKPRCFTVSDDVIVSGVLTAKWSSDMKDVLCDLDPLFVVNHVRRTYELKASIDVPDVVQKFEQFWIYFKDTPLKGRNAILQGICPQIFGCFTVKLAVASTLIGGVQHVDASGTKVRGDSHLLLLGDPGTGKSKFMKFAAKLSNRSVMTTGLGSTRAGLTVTAVKDGGEWMLEAGALVLPDGGICCIDEFDSMREHDRSTIHEAMEQQTISVAKTGLVTTLHTRTIVFGATNAKGSTIPQNQGDSETGKSDEDLTSVCPLPLLQRYIHFVKGHFKPVLTKEAERIISSYYQLQRRTATEDAAHARLMFRNVVTRLDAIAAILCIESSMMTSAIVDSVGNALHSNFAENPDQEYAKQEKMILAKLNSDSLDEFPDRNNLEV